MITSPQEYNRLVNYLMDPTEYTKYIRIPTDEKIYEIDLNTRKCEVPSFVAVNDDHNAEIIWFMCDRFYDNIDLYSGACWIQYINAEGDMFYFAPPQMIDVDNFGSDKILIPWVISKEAAKSGNLQFAFQFFKTSEDGLQFLYVLNTQVAKTKVLNSLPVVDPENDAKEAFAADELRRLLEAYNRLSGDFAVYWLEV